MRLERLLGLGALLALTAGCGKETFQTPPDCSGRRMVAFARTGGPDTADVFLYDLEAFGFHLLPNLNIAEHADQHPTVSPDGRLIAFERTLAPASSDILIYDRCSASIVPQPNLNGASADHAPWFTHDGLRLAFTRDTLNRSVIRLYDAPTDRFVPLPGLQGASGSDYSPSPDESGNRIAFVSTRGTTQDVFVYDATGDSLLDLANLNSAQNDVDPALSANGRYLAFASDRAGGQGNLDLYLYDLQTKQFVALAPGVNTSTAERHPSLDPFGQRIAFESSAPGTLGGADLWLYTLSTGHVDQILGSSAAQDVQPFLVWQ